MVRALPGGAELDVAARSLGLGTTFTTFHMFMENELRELLGIPAGDKIRGDDPDWLAAE